MLNSKRIVIAVFAFLSSPLAMADGWFFEADALYLQPSFGGNGLGYSSFSNYSGNDDNGRFVGSSGAPNRINTINPHWDWGFELDGGYYFNPKSDIDMQWYHFDNRTRGYLPTGSLFSGNYDGFYAGYADTTQAWDAINLELGHVIDFDTYKAVRLHAGVSYGRIQNKFTTYPQLYSVGPPLFITKDKLSYEGFGPRVGADFDYTVGHGFGVYAKTGITVLVGTAKQNNSGFQNYTNSVYGFQPYGTPNYAQSSHGIIVTELDAKLGLTYDYALSNGTVSFDVGYLWMTYLNAIVNYAGIGIVGTADGASIGTHNVANFNLNGLFFGLKWTGDIQ